MIGGQEKLGYDVGDQAGDPRLGLLFQEVEVEGKEGR